MWLTFVFLNCAYGCGLVLLVAFTLVILKWCFVYLKKPAQSSIVQPVKVEPVKVERVPAPAPPKEIIEIKRKVLVAQSPVPEPEPEENGIECGQCGKEILSACVEIQKAPKEEDDLKIFECEHCHTRVAIKANT